MTKSPRTGTPPADQPVHAQHRREAPDPHEARRPPPALYLVFFGAMAAIGFTYLWQMMGPDLALEGDGRSAQRAAAVAETGEELFRKNCSSCHQTSGLGISHVYPPLAGSPWLTGDKETPIRIVLLGLRGDIEVKGDKYAGAMTPFGALSDQQVALILTHERSSWGNQAEPVAASDVAKVRAALAGRTEPLAGGRELEALRARTP